MDVIDIDELASWLDAPDATARLAGATGGRATVIDARGGVPQLSSAARRVLTELPGVSVVVARPGAGSGASLEDFDVVVDNDHDAAEVDAAVTARPRAATALALLLRDADRRDPASGLIAESATYSMLQAGGEFRAWLEQRGRRRREPEPGPRVVIDRADHQLRITLARPARHNAFDAAMRDELFDALAVAAADPSITDVRLEGAGPSFCSGGDLDEFGSVDDPSAAHLLRLSRSVALALSRLEAPIEARVHGACIGAGIELAAFAGRVVAAADARFSLPEVSMGLVPGAGGTVSISRRVGRQRTAWLAITGRTIDAGHALDWGLVDAVE